MQQRLLIPPLGYQFIEYAERKKTDAGAVYLPYGFDDTDVIEIRGSNASGATDNYLIAPESGWNNNNNRFAMLGGLSGKFMFCFGKQGTPNNLLVPETAFDENAHTATYKNKVFSIVDLNCSADMSSVEFGGTTNNLKLFYGYNSATAGRIYYFKQKKINGNKLYVLPIQSVQDGTVEMYDIISKTIMTRTGTLFAPQ